MVDKVEAPDPTTVVFRLKFATTAFLPALADPFAFIYKKEILDKDPRWYEKNIMGSGPFKFVAYETGQSIKGVRNPDYYHKGLPYLDGFVGDLRRRSRRPGSTRSAPTAPPPNSAACRPSARDELQGRSATRSRCRHSDWNCGSSVDAEPQEEAVRRRAGAPRADAGDRPLEAARRRCRRSPTCTRSAASSSPARRSPPTKEELQQIAGFWPDIEKSRAEAKRLLKEAGRRGPQLRAAEPQRRPAL